MKSFIRLLPVGISSVFLFSCATRSAFTPNGGPVTVGMPAELSKRERTFIPEVDSVLRNAGYMPVRHGTGELRLQFLMEEGPINTDTTIVLQDDRRVLAEGKSRGSGLPLIGRGSVAERSFRKAMDDFQAELPRTTSGRLGQSSSSRVPDEDRYVY